MKRSLGSTLGTPWQGAARLCVLALALSACQTSETKEATQTSALSPAPAAPAASSSPTAITPKAGEPAAAMELTLEPASSKLEIVAAKITRSHDGSFKQFSGTASVAGDQVRAVNFDVDTASLQTDTDKLTAHIKTKDFLDVEQFPKASFKSTQIVAKPAGSSTHQVTGQLTLHGVTQEITFPATIDVTPDSITGRAQIGIDRQKFGVAYPGMPDDLIKDEVVLKPVLVFVRKKI